MARRLAAVAALMGACAGPGAESRPARVVIAPAPALGNAAVRPHARATRPAAPPLPTGEPRSAVWIEIGRRNPVSLAGSIAGLEPDESPGRGGWSRVTLAGPGDESARSFAVLLGPGPLRLPFLRGEPVAVELDCRRGGFHRVCDATVRDGRRRLLLAIAGSGYRRLIAGWDVTPGARATSEVLREEPLSVRHTGGIVVAIRGKKWTIPPLAWTLIATPDGAYAVHGASVAWEGTRPPDARDHVEWAAVRWE